MTRGIFICNRVLWNGANNFLAHVVLWKAAWPSFTARRIYVNKLRNSLRQPCQRILHGWKLCVLGLSVLALGLLGKKLSTTKNRISPTKNHKDERPIDMDSVRSFVCIYHPRIGRGRKKP
ncbi:hypothetical protein F4861DRAFT_371426 [Xylaria intraflava]|nr:hypothetical protein F4861DRAFT_371426 [Xylaria intraflava]